MAMQVMKNMKQNNTEINYIMKTLQVNIKIGFEKMKYDPEDMRYWHESRNIPYNVINEYRLTQFVEMKNMLNEVDEEMLEKLEGWLHH